MLLKSKSALAVLLLLFTVTGCTLSGKVADRVGVGEAIALSQMEGTYGDLLRARNNRLRDSLNNPALSPRDLEDLKQQFHQLSVEAEGKARATEDNRYKARFFHLAARAAIGAADYKADGEDKGRENKTGVLASDATKACSALAAANDLRAQSSICLSSEILAPIGAVSSIVREISNANALTAKPLTMDTIEGWSSTLADQFDRLMTFATRRAGAFGVNAALQEVAIWNALSSVCNIQTAGTLAIQLDEDDPAVDDLANLFVRKKGELESDNTFQATLLPKMENRFDCSAARSLVLGTVSPN